METNRCILPVEKVTTASLNTAVAGENTGEAAEGYLLFYLLSLRLSGKVEVLSTNTLHLFYLKSITFLLLKTTACSAFKI